MRIILQNEYGKFEIGGGSHSVARLLKYDGLGTVSKSAKKITFVNQPGSVMQSMRDNERTITLSFDFYGNQKKVEDLYNIICHPVNILFVTSRYRRKIQGVITDTTQAINIIYGIWQSIAIQFICNNPYFNDWENTLLPLANIENQFPNLQESDGWFVNLPAVATMIKNSAIITNKGDTILYPILHIRNISTAISSSGEHGIIIKNNTTGKIIEFNHFITSGEIITADIPNRKITSNISGDITKYISDDTVLSDFFLEIGDNEISVESLDIADVLTVDIEYNNNYMAVVL